MKAKDAFYGAMCGLLVFVILFWAEPRKTVSAQARPASPAASPAVRFQVVELHTGTPGEWSGLLDTETGCTWIYSYSTDERTPGLNPAFDSALFNTSSYPLLSAEEMPHSGEIAAVKKADVLEGARESALCDQRRVRALQAAAGR